MSSGPVADHGEDPILPDMFDAQVRRTPEAVAVEGQGMRLSYAELRRRADHLARVLRGRGVGRGIPVAICVERSPEMLVGLLGILKAGGAYIPLDPGYPPERLAFMIDHSRTPMLLTQSRLLDRLPKSTATATLPGGLQRQVAGGGGRGDGDLSGLSRTTWPTSSIPRARPGGPRASQIPHGRWPTSC